MTAQDLLETDTPDHVIELAETLLDRSTTTTQALAGLYCALLAAGDDGAAALLRPLLDSMAAYECDKV